MIKYCLMERIPLEDICLEMDNYSLEYCLKEQNLDNLFLDIPLLVLDGSRYFPVFGKRYITEQKSYLPYGFIVEKTDDPYEFLRNLINLKNGMRGFNVIEKAIALKKLYDKGGKVDSDILKQLNIPDNDRYIKGNLTLASAPDTIKDLVLDNKIDEITVFDIFQFHRDDWEKVACFISRIRLGTKKRNEIINMIFDIAKRDGKRVDEIIQNDKVIEIQKLDIDPPHIGQRLYSYFEQLRYPTVSNYRKRFYNKLKEVGIDKSFRLKFPPNFEKWVFEITFCFSSVEDFKRKVEHLQAIGYEQSFKELMNLKY